MIQARLTAECDGCGKTESDESGLEIGVFLAAMVQEGWSWSYPTVQEPGDEATATPLMIYCEVCTADVDS
jgi:hypothetical protein